MSGPFAELERVDVRAAWLAEDRDFTPWLANNLDQLSRRVGFDLELVGIEVPVGPFRVDIVATIPGTDEIVIIENQYGPTDHDHLGKLMTYAAGQDASYAIWIAESFRPEHRSALQWANRNSIDGVGFFGFRLEALRIADSPIAIQLATVVEPDNWAKQAPNLAGTASPRMLQYAAFWEPLLEDIRSRYPGWTNANTAPKQNWIALPAGLTGVAYGVVFTQGRTLMVELYVDAVDPEQQSERWQALCAARPQIDARLPGLEWHTLPERRASRIALHAPQPADVADASNHDELRHWAIDALGRLRDALQSHVAALG